MRLISCHVNNYGKISNKTFDFEKGITEFYLDNGEGKTTLASFIRAMLYGLESYTKATKVFVERKRYYPFGGGSFGGSLTFEHGGHEYTVERTFDKASKTRDTVKLYCGGSEMETEETTPLGMRMLGLDSESFARTLYVDSDDMELRATAGIGGKLNGYVGADIDLDSALDAVDKAARKYRTSRTGKNGLIPKSEEEEKRLRAKLDNLKDIDNALGRYYGERNELAAELKKEREEYADEVKLAATLAKWKTYDSYIEGAEAEKASIAELMSAYPKGFPDNEAVTGARAELAELVRVRAEEEASVLGAQETRLLECLGERFAAGVPDSDEIGDAKRALSDVSEYKARINAQRELGESEDEREVLSRFSERRPSEGELSLMNELEAEYVRLSGDAKQAPKTAALTPRISPKVVVLCVLGVLALIGGALSMLAIIALGAVLMVLGVLLVVGGIAVHLSARMRAVEGARMLADTAELDRAFAELSAMLALYGYSGSDGVLIALERLRFDLDVLSRLEQRHKKRDEDIAQLEAKIKKAEQDVHALLEKYGYEGEELSVLEEDVRLYSSLKKRENERTKARLSARERCDALVASLSSFFLSYRDTVPEDMNGALDALNADTVKYNGSVRIRDAQIKKAEQYKLAQGLSERPTGECADMEALNESIGRKTRELSDLDLKISDMEQMVSELDETQAELERLREDIAEYKEKYQLIRSCEELLRRADENLTERYISPIRDRFDRYAAAVKSSFGERVALDKDFYLRFESEGALRENEHLSAGQRCVWALCLRLAFVDELFGEEKPFLILDDPFVSLDEGNMANIARLLGELSSDVQLIYFSCHESRRLNN